MTRLHEVAVLGAGLAGLAAAWRLKGHDVVVLEAEGHVGGRTLSRRFDDGSWANFGAQYVSNDKVTVTALADELGLELVPAGFHSDEFRGLDALDAASRRDVEVWVARLEAEMARPRPATAPELDRVSVAEWLGDAPAHVHDFFERWCGLLIFGSTLETSLYGLMLLWGDQRTSAFSTPPVPRNNRGETVVRGGTHELAKALAAASGADIRSSHRITRVSAEEGCHLIAAEGPQGPVTVAARRVVCALPAPVAAEVIAGLPPAKAAALGAIRYGRNIATPIAVLPRGHKGPEIPLVPSRPGAVYNSNGFVLRTPGDIASDGGCFHSYIHDVYARVVWDDPEDSVRSGALRAFRARFPELADRVHFVGYRRWPLALPHYRPGRQALQPALDAPVGGIQFCGDYMVAANTDGAARSGRAAAEAVLASL